MAYVAQNRSGAWEIRESRTTAKGPRSKTLATFTALDDEVVAKAVSRSAAGLGAAELRETVLRAGAPIAEATSDRAAKELLVEMRAGRQPRRALLALLARAVEGAPEIASDEAGSVAEWLGASPQERGDVLRELLELGDAFPHKGRGDLLFPPLRPVSS
jgi:hypothetical protein